MNVMFLIIKYRLFLHKINFCLPIKGRINSQVEPELLLHVQVSFKNLQLQPENRVLPTTYPLN